MDEPERRAMGSTTKHAKLTINIPPHLLAAAQGVAKLKDTSVAELVRDAVRQYVLHHAPLIQQELELLNAAAEFNRLGDQPAPGQDPE